MFLTVVLLHSSSGRADNLYIVTVMRALVVVLVDPHAQDAVASARSAARSPSSRTRSFSARVRSHASCTWGLSFAFFNPAFRHYCVCDYRSLKLCYTTVERGSDGEKSEDY